jgi:glycosyltransferase involved in cell wall biosynthesis
MRAEALLASNNIAKTDLLFLPVSLPKGENRNKSSWLYDHCAIAPDKKIILYYGMINKDRRCFELAELSSHLPDDCIMVLHGFGFDEEIDPLQDKIKYGDLVLSLEFAAQHEIKDLISSATIGLVIYGNNCNNDILTAFSSEKIALFLQSGIPIIAFDMGNYRELMDAYRCGELIADIKELPKAVKKILNDYDEYRKEAFAAYSALYRYEKYFETIRAYLQKM